MFERYTEQARRVIFFARYEASALGSPYINSEHLLLGLFREDRDMIRGLFASPDAPAAIRNEIESQPHGEKLPTSVDLPLAHESKRALAYAAEESERLQSKFIGTRHLLIGLLKEETSAAAKLLARHGVQLERVRQMKDSESGQPTTERDVLYRLVDQLPVSLRPAAEEMLRKLIRGESIG